MLAAEEAIDIPCNACEVCSIGYRSASWLPSVGRSAYRVNDMVDRSVVKCDLNLYHQHLQHHLRGPVYIPILNLTILERCNSCLSKSIQGIADKEI
jgi:hypothetical protein